MGLPCDRKEVGLGNAFTFCSARIWAASETGFPPNFIKQANYGQLSDMFCLGWKLMVTTGRGFLRDVRPSVAQPGAWHPKRILNHSHFRNSWPVATTCI